VALVLAAVAIVVSAGIPLFRDRAPFIIPVLAVAASAWLGGLGPSLLGAATAAAALTPLTTPEPLRAILFLMLSAVIGLLGESARRRRDERARLRAANEQAERRFAFLAEASALLTASLEYDTTLPAIARLAVPFLADWCTVDLIERDGRVRRVALAYGNPTKAELVRSAESYPDDPEGRHPRTRVLRTGRAELAPDVDEAALAEITSNPEQLRVMRALHYRSAMIVPLLAHGTVVGALTFATAESDRRYGPADLSLAEDLARRAALAIVNARLYRDAQDARGQAEAASQAKDEFLAVVSHELRTPLATALLWTRLLSRDLPPDKITYAAATIERSMRRQAMLVEDLLDGSRIVTGTLRLERQPVNLAAIVAEAVTAVRTVATAKGIALDIASAPLPGRVVGDRSRLEQVVAKLLENAIEYTPAGGAITVRVDADDGRARVAVADTGEGIDAALLPHVFDRFRQADSTTRRRHGGLGLGLAIVRELVVLHGGTVRAESAGRDRGATFVVELPLAAEEARAS
jgi:signal transduction histidine kinase